MAVNLRGILLLLTTIYAFIIISIISLTLKILSFIGRIISTSVSIFTICFSLCPIQIEFILLYLNPFKRLSLKLWNIIAVLLNYEYPINEIGNKIGCQRFDKRNNEVYVDAQYCVKLATYIYFVPFLSLTPEGYTAITPCTRVVHVVYEPRYMILHDARNDRIIVVLSGTRSFLDVITDGGARSQRITIANINGSKDPKNHNKHNNVEYRVHAGIFEAAINLYQDIETAIIESNYYDSNNTSVFITGHSFGAGVASVISFLWLNNLEPMNISRKGSTGISANMFHLQDRGEENEVPFRNQFKCFSFASPCIMNKLLVDYVFNNDKNNQINTFVFENDIVTRLSTQSFRSMNNSVEIIERRLCRYGCWVKKVENNHFSNLDRAINESKITLIENENTIDNNNLYPIGKILWYLPRFIGDNSNKNNSEYNNNNNNNNTIKDIYTNLIDSIKGENYLICQLLYYMINYQTTSGFDNVLYSIEDTSENINDNTNIRIKFFQKLTCNNASFLSHMPDNYLRTFNVSLSDVAQMSVINEKEIELFTQDNAGAFVMNIFDQIENKDIFIISDIVTNYLKPFSAHLYFMYAIKDFTFGLLFLNIRKFVSCGLFR